MTNEDILKIAEVLCTVDGGCGSCVREAAYEMEQRFPDIPWQDLVTAEGERTGAYWARKREERHGSVRSCGEVAAIVKEAWSSEDVLSQWAAG